MVAVVVELKSMAVMAEVAHTGPAGMFRARYVRTTDEGLLVVDTGAQAECLCEVLLPAAQLHELSAGDSLLVALTGGAEPGVVLGRVGPLGSAAIPSAVAIEASESLTLKCGDSSVALRADGKVVIRGDDVLVRAKGTQRIRAGSVSIN